MKKVSFPVTKKEKLIILAAEMATCKNMVSSNIDDWISRRTVLEHAEKAENQCKDWAVRLRNTYNEI